MPPLPKGVVRRACPSKHSTHEQERNNRYKHHSPGFAPHVRHRIQRHLPALGRRFIASHLGDQSVRRFVTRRRKQKRDIPDESENEKIGSEILQVIGPFPQLSPSRLEVVTLLCKQAGRSSLPSQPAKVQGLLLTSMRNATCPHVILPFRRRSQDHPPIQRGSVDPFCFRQAAFSADQPLCFKSSAVGVPVAGSESDSRQNRNPRLIIWRSR